LAENLEELKGYVEKIQQCNPEACRKRVEDMFSDEVMTNNYLQLFEKVLEEHPESRW
jgi:DNA-directed RNA polymerase subunit F